MMNHAHLKWDSNQPLAGRTVVITRAQNQAEEFVTELEQYGAEVILCPTIEISELESYERLDEAIEHLYGYDWLIFTSVNGVEHFFKRLKARDRKDRKSTRLNSSHRCTSYAVFCLKNK